MNGAQALINTLVDGGVDVCFANPGTSEMHFVAALDAVPRMRGMLTLFEGVATGAADGYARIAGRPAAVLLASGPRTGQRPGQPAQTRAVPGCRWWWLSETTRLTHKKYDAPLESDIDAVAGTVSGWCAGRRLPPTSG
ncbi:decarboxylase, partial [Mycobacterium tuberculosis CPHL_A]